LWHYAASWKVAGSSADEAIDFSFSFPNSSNRTRPLSIKKMFLGSKAPLARKADCLNANYEPIV
jgi:hypothetical protein